MQNASARATVSAEVSRLGTSSTRRSTGTGLKKCMPITRCGWGVTAASFMIGIDDVLLASSASGRATLPSAWKIAIFSASSSMTASTTRSRSASVGDVRHGADPALGGLPVRGRQLARLLRARERLADPSQRALGVGLVHLADDHVAAGARGHLRDAGAHDPAADDADGRHPLRGARGLLRSYFRSHNAPVPRRPVTAVPSRALGGPFESACFPNTVVPRRRLPLDGE